MPKGGRGMALKRETVFVKVGANKEDISSLAHKQYWAGEQVGKVGLLPALQTEPPSFMYLPTRYI